MKIICDYNIVKKQNQHHNHLKTKQIRRFTYVVVQIIFKSKTPFNQGTLTLQSSFFTLIMTKMKAGIT